MDAAWLNGLTREEATAKLHQEEWLTGKNWQEIPLILCTYLQCTKCEEVCLQHIKIRDELEKIAAELLG